MCLDCWRYTITCKIPQSELAFVLTTISGRYSGQPGHAWLKATRSREGHWHKWFPASGQRVLSIIPILAVLVITAFMALFLLHNTTLRTSNKFKMIQACLSWNFASRHEKSIFFSGSVCEYWTDCLGFFPVPVPHYWCFQWGEKNATFVFPLTALLLECRSAQQSQLKLCGHFFPVWSL